MLPPLMPAAKGERAQAVFAMLRELMEGASQADYMRVISPKE